MEYRKLSRSGIEVSRIGFGCAAIGGYDYGPATDHESIRAVRAALDAGITLFDVADVYGLGRAETVLGRALGKDRHKAIIATKVGIRWDEGGRTWRDLSADYLHMAVNASLSRMGTDYLDIVQIHWPVDGQAMDGSVEILERLRSEGRIRAVGCCNFSLEQIESAGTGGQLSTLQLPFSLGQLEARSTLNMARSGLGMATLAYNVLAQGIFTGKIDRHTRFEGTDLRSRSSLFEGGAIERNLRIVDVLRVIGERINATPAQVAIRWVLEQGDVDCALAGARSPAQVAENAAAADLALSQENFRLLSEIADSSHDTSH